MQLNPMVTILEPVAGRNITTKNGPKTVYSQRASLETEQMRIQVDVECDGPNMGHAVGAQKMWDVASDLVPGRFGVELARRMTLVDRAADAKAPVSAVK